MRKFSESEKEYLEIIINENQSTSPNKYTFNSIIANSFMKEFGLETIASRVVPKDKSIEVVHTNKKNKYIRGKDSNYQNKDNFNQKNLKLNKAINILIEVKNLIEYLESQNLISFYLTSSVDNDENDRYNLTGDEDFRPTDNLSDTIISPDIYEFYSKYADNLFYCTDELKDIVDNDFKTKEQINIEKQVNNSNTQTWLAFTAVIIAFTAVIIAFIAVLVSICK